MEEPELSEILELEDADATGAWIWGDEISIAVLL